MNLIGDIQGNYRTLLALLKQMPDDDPVSVGDMIDRGPRSMEVLEFFWNHGKALLGNHEHMMLDYFCDSGNYMPGLWLMNSGDATLNSLGLKRSGSLPEILQDFLESLPLLLIRDGLLLVTHAPHTAGIWNLLSVILKAVKQVSLWPSRRIFEQEYMKKNTFSKN